MNPVLIIFLCLVGACAILWLVITIGIGIASKEECDDESNPVKPLFTPGKPKSR